MKAGSWADPDFNGSPPTTPAPSTAVLDMSQPSPAWRSTAPMHYPRSYHNLTLLPDGTCSRAAARPLDGIDLTKAVLPAEIWNPDTETWTDVASLTDGREYHSTALLLPDGRVLMAGGGQLPGRATNIYNGEIYSPPYLFKGARPTISAAPSLVQYGVELHGHDAGRGDHPEGGADPDAVGHARVRPEPALRPARRSPRRAAS